MAKRKHARTNNFVPTILISLGILLILLSLFTQTQIFFRYLITFQEKPVVQTATNLPESISIPSQNLQVKVSEGGITNGEWVLSNSNALYLPTSGKLGEGYNTILYAHNTKKLFKKLEDVKKGNSILIRDRIGTLYRYEVYEVEEVNPNDLKKLYSKEKNILTLFTCSGWADSKRTIVRAKLL